MAEIFRLETRSGRGAFQALDDELIRVAPWLMDMVPDRDKALNQYMDDILERRKKWGLADDLKFLFGRANHPQYYRDHPCQWFFGFDSYEQLRKTFPQNDALELMQRKSIYLRVYNVPEADIYRAEKQVLFCARDSVRIGERDLLTGAEIKMREPFIRLPLLDSRQPSI